MSDSAFVLIALVVMFAAFVQGAIGLGFALIAAPILTILAPAFLPVGLLCLMIPLNVYFAYRERAAVDWSSASWITFGRFFGTFGGMWVLAALSPRYLAVFIGWATILTVIVTLFAPSFKPGHKAFVMAGIVTGISETATGIGGPPLALVYQHYPAAILRSTIAFCFLVGEVISIALLSVVGQTTVSQFVIALMLTPAIAVGAILSRYAHNRIGGPRFRALVLGFAVVSGVVLLFRS